MRIRLVSLVIVMIFAYSQSGRSDEGMWLFNAPPLKQLKEKYQFEPTPEWLGHLQRSAVRFNSGGSGSFVSPDGLVLTNHHVGADALQKFSTKEHDYLADGFYAKTQAEEIKCVDLELNVLEKIEDVTKQVEAAVKPGLGSAEAYAARRAAMSAIEKEARDRSGLRSDVVTLYHGGLYHLYQYKKYTDVRLVFAPEQSIAFFGGDPDNFEYPRYDLDVCFFRVYENDKPAKIEHYLEWNDDGAKDHELVFVVGNPGKTDRLNTMTHLEFIRDVTFPAQLDMLRRREVLLQGFSERSLENARRAKDELFGIQNTRKARLGGLAGLQDPALMAEKRGAETKLREAIAKNPKLASSAGAWQEVDGALAKLKAIYTRFRMFEGAAAFYTDYFHIARDLVRMAEELPKPNGERLREYRDSALDSLNQQLYSTAPIYDDLETIKLADSLGYMIEQLGVGDPAVKAILAGKSPRQRAVELVQGTKLKDVEVRKKLAEGGQAAITASTDPMIQLARLVDPVARALRKTHDEQIDEPMRQAYGRIAQARFAIYGDSIYPDATFTLRLSYGVVAGYDADGKHLAPWTTMGGAFEHAKNHGSVPPFELPPSWLKAKDRIKADTPLNFIHTADIIGGNSGSPTVNRQGQFVGIIFDGNIESLVWDFVYDDRQGRSLSVHAASITEALKNIYGAGPLVEELRRKK